MRQMAWGNMYKYIWQCPINKSAALNRATRGKKSSSCHPNTTPKCSRYVFSWRTEGVSDATHVLQRLFFLLSCNHADHRTNPDDWGFMLDIGGPRDTFMALPEDSYPTIIFHIFSLLSHLLRGSVSESSRAQKSVHQARCWASFWSQWHHEQYVL